MQSGILELPADQLNCGSAKRFTILAQGRSSKAQVVYSGAKRRELFEARWNEPRSCGYSSEAVRAPIFAANPVMYKEEPVGIALIFDRAQA